METEDKDLLNVPWEREGAWIAIWGHVMKRFGGDDAAESNPDIDAVRVKTRAVFEQAWGDLSPALALSRIQVSLGTEHFDTGEREVIGRWLSQAEPQIAEAWRDRLHKAVNNVFVSFWRYEEQIEELKKRL